MEPTDRFERAARFIYLNQTSFNGLYRVNNSGKYNVPYGRRKNVSYNVENLHAVNNCLKHAQIYTGDFEKILRNVKKNDFIYLDPPYVVAKEGNGFIQYNKHLFSLEDQRRLSQCIDLIKENGAFYILSNACHDAIYEIFSKPGDSTIKLYRPSLIGGTNAFRGTAEEYLFTNIPNATDLLADSSHIHNNERKSYLSI